MRSECLFDTVHIVEECLRQARGSVPLPRDDRAAKLRYLRGDALVKCGIAGLNMGLNR